MSPLLANASAKALVAGLLLAALLISSAESRRHVGGGVHAEASSTRDKIKRSRSEPRKFAKQHPCPFAAGNCIVDHIVPLRCAKDAGGPLPLTVADLDKVWNMQWQQWDAPPESRIKDTWEGSHCAELLADPHYRPQSARSAPAHVTGGRERFRSRMGRQ